MFFGAKTQYFNITGVWIFKLDRVLLVDDRRRVCVVEVKRNHADWSERRCLWFLIRTFPFKYLTDEATRLHKSTGPLTETTSRLSGCSSVEYLFQGFDDVTQTWMWTYILSVTQEHLNVCVSVCVTAALLGVDGYSEVHGGFRCPSRERDVFVVRQEASRARKLKIISVPPGTFLLRRHRKVKLFVFTGNWRI